jgi:hypothetical protein
MQEKEVQSCLRCGTQFPIHASFCPKCGWKTEKVPTTMPGHSTLNPSHLQALSNREGTGPLSSLRSISRQLGMMEQPPHFDDEVELGNIPTLPLQLVRPRELEPGTAGEAMGFAADSVEDPLLQLVRRISDTLTLPSMPLVSVKAPEPVKASGTLTLIPPPAVAPEVEEAEAPAEDRSETLSPPRPMSVKILSGIALLICLLLLGNTLYVAARGGTRAEERVNVKAPALRLTYKGHTQSIYQAAWSPKGGAIASAGGLGEASIQIWEPATGKQLLTYSEHTTAALALAWSPDGRYIASAGYGDPIKVWEAQSGHTLFAYNGHHNNSVLSIAWSPDGKRIATGSVDNAVHVWDAITGEHPLVFSGHSSDVTALAWSPDGKNIVSADNEGNVLTWDAITGRKLRNHGNDQGTVYALAWSPNGKYIAVGRAGAEVQVWDALSGKTVVSYKTSAPRVNAVSWTADSQKLAFGGNDRTVQVWNVATGRQVAVYRGHTENINAVSWSPDGQQLVSAGADSLALIWQVVE